MVAFSDDYIYAIVGALALGILLAVLDNWFWRRQRRKRRVRHQ